MSATLINLIIQLIAGAVGGNAAGAAVKNVELAARAEARFSLHCCPYFRALRAASTSASCSPRLSAAA
jgi:hypothetical protein